MTPFLLRKARCRVAWSPVACAVFALSGLPAMSQTASPPSIVITGNPLGRDSLAQPVSSLSGDGLLLRRAGTLGDTLDSLPGTTGSGFGPNSSRPVIRGLDGDRVRVLDNGGATIDASTLSFDHAVAQDPLVSERIELLRGPAALLYGGNATGGVVNSLDNRIPRSPQTGVSGRADLRLGGAAAERSAAAVVDGGQGRWAWHADAFGRRTSDLRTPDFQPDAGEPGVATRVRNSAARAEGGAVGAGWTGPDGHLGLALDSYRNDYGVTVEPDVLIRMRRERLSLGGDLRRLDGVFDQVGFNASHTRYRHQEVEGDGAVGTTFSSRGQDLRVQARHRPLGAWRGVVGLQAERMDFSALGEEAFVPGTRTRSQALFVLEEAEFGPLVLQAGARGEQVRVASEGDLPGAEPRFGDALERRFSPVSASLGLTWRLAERWALGLTLGRTERAPAYYELFANGVHIATAAFERGDATLGLERSHHVGATLEWRAAAAHVKASLFSTRFSRYVSLASTGQTFDTDDGESVPVYHFEGVRARLQGFELEGRWRVVDRPWRVELTAQADAVRGIDLDRQEALPRLAPRRVHAGVDLAAGPWALGLGVRHAARQSRVPAGDTATPGHTVWNAWATWRLPVAAVDTTAFLRLDNLTDRLAYNASAVATIRGLAPQGGRAATAGVRVQW